MEKIYIDRVKKNLLIFLNHLLKLYPTYSDCETLNDVFNINQTTTIISHLSGPENASLSPVKYSIPEMDKINYYNHSASHYTAAYLQIIVPIFEQESKIRVFILRVRSY